jgi:hypothetical protein
MVAPPAWDGSLPIIVASWGGFPQDCDGSNVFFFAESGIVGGYLEFMTRVMSH